MVFDKVIVIGSGKIASDCIEKLTKHTDKIVGCEHEKHPLSSVKATCEKNNIEYRLINSMEELSNYFKEITDRTLIVSANNNFIFSEALIKNPKIKIINFHNALLPKHRGRNAPTWAIYDMDAVTGVTWHEVDECVDTGLIIIQKEVPIDSRMTALQLTRNCMVIGAMAFDECIGSILNEEIGAIKQKNGDGGKLHNSKSIPNNGIFDLSWEIDKMSAFLRSLDYGKFQIFPDPKCLIMGKEYIITRYAIDNSYSNYLKSIVFSTDRILLTDNGISISITLSVH